MSRRGCLAIAMPNQAHCHAGHCWSFFVLELCTAPSLHLKKRKKCIEWQSEGNSNSNSNFNHNHTYQPQRVPCFWSHSIFSWHSSPFWYSSSIRIVQWRHCPRSNTAPNNQCQTPKTIPSTLTSRQNRTAANHGDSNRIFSKTYKRNIYITTKNLELKPK